MRRFLLAFVLALSGAQAALAQATSAFTQSGVITTTGIPASSIVQLNGHNQCAVQIAGTYSGLTIVPQASNDWPSGTGGSVHWNPASSLNFGLLSPANNSSASYQGVVSDKGLAAFSLSVTAIASGSAYFTISCSPASSAGTSDNQLGSVSSLWVTSGGAYSLSAASAATTVIKSSAGRLVKLLVTATGTGVFTCYDNASTGSGKVLGAFPASVAVGTVEVLDMPAANGITCVSAASGPVVTASYF